MIVRGSERRIRGTFSKLCLAEHLAEFDLGAFLQFLAFPEG